MDLSLKNKTKDELTSLIDEISFKPKEEDVKYGVIIKTCLFEIKEVNDPSNIRLGLMNLVETKDFNVVYCFDIKDGFGAQRFFKAKRDGLLGFDITYLLITKYFSKQANVITNPFYMGQVLRDG